MQKLKGDEGWGGGLFFSTDPKCLWVFLHEKVSVSLDKWEALCILMQYEIELMYSCGIISF